MIACCDPIPGPFVISRRQVLIGFTATMTAAVALRPVRAERAGVLPAEVAGIRIPRSSTALRAVAFSRAACPEYLFNHCLRTFVFGALYLKKQQRSYDAEPAFIASVLHDLGLLPAYASKAGSFEIDGADAAEKFARDAGLAATEADTIWHSVAFHDGRFAITRRAGAEAMLVAAGAGADVDGPDTDSADQRQIAEVLAAFPRLQFKQRFTALLIDHCKRKPVSQSGTWLEGLCREQVPQAWHGTTEQEIAGSGYAE
jgi:hypothetical protein